MDKRSEIDQQLELDDWDGDEQKLL